MTFQHVKLVCLHLYVCLYVMWIELHTRVLFLTKFVTLGVRCGLVPHFLTL